MRRDRAFRGRAAGFVRATGGRARGVSVGSRGRRVHGDAKRGAGFVVDGGPAGDAGLRGEDCSQGVIRGRASNDSIKPTRSSLTHLATLQVPGSFELTRTGGGAQLVLRRNPTTTVIVCAAMTPSGSTLVRCVVALTGFAVMVGCHHVAETPWPVVEPRPDAAFLIGEIRSTRHGRPAEQARVRLISLESSRRDSTLADHWGRFSFGPVPPGAYRVQVSTIGFRTLSQDAHLKAGAIDTLRLQLKYDTSGVIRDCISPDGRQLGSQFCRP